MKSLVVALSLVVLTAVSPAFAQRNLDFTLLNRTGLTINELYVSPSKSDDWEEDVLGRDVLKHGETVDITFARNETSCTWDLKIVDSDGDSVSWSSIDLCTAAHITLQYEDGKPTATIK
jgi:hypothetical protein